MLKSISIIAQILFSTLLLFKETSAEAQSPALGSHVLGFQWYGDRTPTLSTSAITTQALHSVVIMSVGRGVVSGNNIPPTDNKGNIYTQLGASHIYTNWPSSGTAIYANTSLVGGSGHVFNIQTNDEVTLMVIEVVNGGKVQDYKWNEVLKGQPLTSLSVTTTSAATLVAYWWGDNGSGPHTAVPNNGFVVQDSILLAGSLVQGAVATKEVSAAGTYNVTWTSTPLQGAQLWLIAVQNSGSGGNQPKAPTELQAE